MFNWIKKLFNPPPLIPAKGLSQPKYKRTTPIKKGVVDKKKRGTRKSRARRR